MSLRMMVGVLAQVWTAVPEGRTPADAELTRVSDVTVRGQTMYVLDPNLQQLLLYNLKGVPIARIGRKGGGPGEFTQAVRMGWLGDTLWVTDYPNRVHYFAPNGTLYRTIPVQVTAHGPTASGGVLVTEHFATPGSPVGDGIIRALTLRHYAASGATREAAQLNLFVGPLRVKAMIDGTRVVSLTRHEPLRDDPLFVMDREGRFLWIVLRRTRREAPHEFRLVKLTTAGDTVLARRYPYQPRRLEKVIVDATLDELEQVILTQAPGYQTRVMREELAKELYRPFHLPAVEQVLAGQDGTVWLRRESVPGGKAVYLVLSRTGAQLGTLHLPPGERLVEADGQRVWTVAEDEDGVPTVTWYRVRRSE